jgi:hypothetical protein
MRDTELNREYLKEMQAVEVSKKTCLDKYSLPEYITLFTRTYYKKRNGKICYIDNNFKKFAVDETKVTKVCWKEDLTTINDLLYGGGHNIIENCKYMIDEEYLKTIKSNYENNS